MDTQNVLSLYYFEVWNFLSCYLQLSRNGLALAPWAKRGSRIFQFWERARQKWIWWYGREVRMPVLWMLGKSWRKGEGPMRGRENGESIWVNRNLQEIIMKSFWCYPSVTKCFLGKLWWKPRTFLSLQASARLPEPQRRFKTITLY